MDRKGGWIGWHFLSGSRCLRWGTKEEVKVGRKYTVNGDPVLCVHGFHASKKALDALDYAPGPIVCKVRLSGVIVEGPDKASATEREVLAMADATEVLREFACWYTEKALNPVRGASDELDVVKVAWVVASNYAWAAAARDVARGDSCAVVRDRQNTKLEEMLGALIAEE